ncbi:MAG: hypothetical protein K8S97_02800, partial [Anaerolineae bacterium]|nr:hypothetical protein [Anaerolineae bacterium]
VAAVNVPGQIALQAVGGGFATVTLSVTDNINAPVVVQFDVTVVAPNAPPTIQPLADQALTVGETINVAVVASDPDGDPFALVATAQNGAVVTAIGIGTDTVQLLGVGEGVTVVDVVVDDAKGGVATVSFNVTVSSISGGFDLNAYPVVPDITPAMAQSLNQLYQSGITNFGNRPGVFVLIGDETTERPNFMAPFGPGGAYNLGSRTELQETIDFYNVTPAHNGDPAMSFNVDSVAAGGGYGIDTLSSPAPAGGVCDAVGGGTLVSCELQLARGSIALISFSGPNVTYLPPEQFRAELQVLVADLLTNYGVIPVLATIPAGNGVTTEQLMPYNQAIVEVAQNSGVAGVPLWNLWRAINNRGIDPLTVAPGGAGDFTDAGLGYGYNVKNFTGLRALQAVRSAVGIN